MKLTKVQGLSIVLVLVLVVSGIGLTSLYIQKNDASNQASESAARLQMTEVLLSVEARAWPELLEISDNLTKASEELSALGLNGTEVRQVLKGAKDNMTYAVDTLTMDKNGVIVATYPSDYESSEGTNISDQPHIVKVLKYKVPVMSEVFTTVEGFVAAAMHIPVFDLNGTFIGTVCATINVQGLIDDIAAEELSGTTLQFLCLQTDGMEVYDTDEAQIGLNVFTDPVYNNYTEMKTFIRDKVIAESEGYGTYHFNRSLASNEIVNKQAYWSTFGLYGSEWRLVVLRAM